MRFRGRSYARVKAHFPAVPAKPLLNRSRTFTPFATPLVQPQLEN
jgi:hypothetical protein